MRSRRLTTLSVLAFGLSLVVGCSTSSASAGREVVPGASQKTFTGGSVRVTLDYSFSGPVTADLGINTGQSFHGEGGVDFQRRSSQVEVTAPPRLAGGGSIETVTGEPSTLVNVPQLAQRVPNAKPWVRSNPADPAQRQVLGALNQFLWLLDPVVAVESLNAAETNGTKLGDEVVRRVDTTRYRFRLDVARAVGALEVSERDRYQQAISGLPDTNVDVEVWVDPHGRLARFRAKVTLGGNGGSVSVVLEFHEYGAPVAVTPPPPDQVSEPAALLPRPVTVEQLRNAPVPSLCGYPGGRLVDGHVPGVPSRGLFQVAEAVSGSSPGPYLAVGDLSGDGVDEGVAVVVCVPPGSNSGYDGVLVYSGGPALIGEVPFAKEVAAPGFYPPSVQGIRIEDEQVVIRGQAHQKDDPHCCPSVSVVQRFRLSGSSFTLDQSSGLGTITPDGMGAVRVGMTVQEVAAASNHLVAAQSMQGNGSVEGEPCFSLKFLGSPEGVYGVGGQGRLRAMVVARSAPYATAEGIHVGSTEAEVISTYQGRARQYKNIYHDVPDYYVGALPREDGNSLRFEIDPRTRLVDVIHAGASVFAGLPEGCS